jgi:hypothetical protein
LKIAPLLAGAALAAGCCLAAMPASGAALSVPSGSSPWSTPASLSACAAIGAPHVVFPSKGPRQATGPGAIVWSASPGCQGGAGARVAALGAGELASASTIPRTAAGRPLAPRGALLASGAPHAQIVIAGDSPSVGADAQVIQGVAGGAFAPLLVPAGAAPPAALATAYLGDVALASSPAGAGPAGALDLHLERFYSRRFVRNSTVRGGGGGAVRALTLALDYRSEALAVWAQRGELYARLLPSAGGARLIQPLAPVSAAPTIAAVLSDDGHAIVSWSEREGMHTSVYLDRSAAGVRFGAAPELLERFTTPHGQPAPACSPSLVRLSSEGVVLAWAGSAGERWVVRVAAVDLSGTPSIETIDAGALDARLAALAAGPDDDALVLWTEPQPGARGAGGAPDTAPQSIFAARGSEAAPAGIAFDEAEPVAPPAAVADASVAFDPDNDLAVAAWRGEGGAIEYSIRSQGPRG